MLKKINFLFILLFSVSSFSCAQSNSHTMTVAELKSEMKTDSTLVLLDVRTPQELTGPLGHIEGVINIPVQELEVRLNELSKYKSNRIAVICRSGNRSGMATSILVETGFNARNVLGGMIKYNLEK